MKINIDKNNLIYSFDNLDNYNEKLNNTLNEIIKKYCEIIYEFLKFIFKKTYKMVRSRRLELPRVLPHNDLNVTRIPIPPRPQKLLLSNFL